MSYKVTLLLSAQKDLEIVLEYYNEISGALTTQFYREFVEMNSILEQNPFFKITYHSVRTYKLKTFPYLVHFVINEELNLVTIIAIVFGKQEKTNFGDRFIG